MQKQLALGHFMRALSGMHVWGSTGRHYMPVVVAGELATCECMWVHAVCCLAPVALSSATWGHGELALQGPGKQIPSYLIRFAANYEGKQGTFSFTPMRDALTPRHKMVCVGVCPHTLLGSWLAWHMHCCDPERACHLLRTVCAVGCM